MAAPTIAEFSAPCLCAGRPVTICTPGDRGRYGLKNSSREPQRRTRGVCKGTGRIFGHDRAAASLADMDLDAVAAGWRR